MAWCLWAMVKGWLGGGVQELVPGLSMETVNLPVYNSTSLVGGFNNHIWIVAKRLKIEVDKTFDVVPSLEIKNLFLFSFRPSKKQGIEVNLSYMNKLSSLI